MIWLALALTLLFVAGGVLMVRPSPAQRRIAALRQHAMSRGLRIRLGQQLDLPPRLTAEATQVVAYIAQRQSRAKGVSGQIMIDAGRCDPDSAEGCFRRAGDLPEVPPGVRMLQCTPTEVMALWDETGTAESVDQIAQILDGLKERT